MDLITRHTSLGKGIGMLAEIMATRKMIEPLRGLDETSVSRFLRVTSWRLPQRNNSKSLSSDKTRTSWESMVQPELLFFPPVFAMSAANVSFKGDRLEGLEW